MAKAKRSLYKRERAPKRADGQIRGSEKCISLLDADPREIASALKACGSAMRDSSDNRTPINVGRCLGYDALRDRYTVLGKDMVTGKVGEFDIEGEVVAELILLTRVANGGKHDSQRLAKTTTGLDANPYEFAP